MFDNGSTFVQHKGLDFAAVSEQVNALCESENSYKVSSSTSDMMSRLSEIDNYSEFGLGSLGRLTGFPAKFVTELYNSNHSLANTILEDRIKHYFERYEKGFTVREFNDQICGAVTDKYAFFDDNQVMEIISSSELSNLEFQTVHVSPERLHLRALDTKHPFTVKGDNSNMYFMYYIDNSMLGGCSFKVRLGVFRQVCSNGLIVPARNFTICKQVHRGKKDIMSEFKESLEFISQKRDDIINLLNDCADADSKIKNLSDEFRSEYLSKRLATSKAETKKIIDLYSFTYGGKTKWDMVNAITEFARDVKSIERRELLESKALVIA